jgi:hypothetical protein
MNVPLNVTIKLLVALAVDVRLKEGQLQRLESTLKDKNKDDDDDNDDDDDDTTTTTTTTTTTNNNNNNNNNTKTLSRVQSHIRNITYKEINTG